MKRLSKRQGMYMKNSLTIILTAMFFSLPTTTAAAKEILVFKCDTVRNKTIKISRIGDKLFYSYGKDQNKDVEIERNLYRSDIPGMFSDGIIMANKSGPYIYNTISFDKDEYEYIVTALSEINVASEKTFSGIYVQKNGIQREKIKCQEGTIKNNFESLYK